MKGKVVLMTGGTSGLGRAAAEKLARLGATVVVHGRDAAKGQRAVEELRQASGNPEVHLLLADLSSLKSVRACADEFRQRFGRLDVLVLNAASAAYGHEQRSETVDGHEFFFATNYLSHYLLTRLLLDLLEASAPSRIVVVGAQQMGAHLDFEDLQSRRDWSQLKAVTRAKLGMFCLTRALAERLQGKRIIANILDPGLVMTPYQDKSSWLMKLFIRLVGKPAEYVAETYVQLATAPELEGVSGRCFRHGKEIPIRGEARDERVVQRLWEESAKLVGLAA
jgi:NAD(P)-dependent dehydrogenase (short-subunit alcohol dehydrogenase family)